MLRKATHRMEAVITSVGTLEYAQAPSNHLKFLAAMG